MIANPVTTRGSTAVPALALMAALLAAAPAARAQATSPLTIIPDDATVAVTVRGLSIVGPKIDAAAAALGELLPIPVAQPSLFLKAAIEGGLKINKGLDEKGTLFAVIPNLSKAGIESIAGPQAGQVAVIGVPGTSIDELAGNLGFAAGELKPGAAPVERNGMHYAARGNYLLGSKSGQALKAVLAGKPLAGSLTAARKAEAEKADIWFHASPAGAPEQWASLLAQAESQFAVLPPDSAEQIKKVFGYVKDAQSASAAISLDDGLTAAFRIVAKPGTEFAGLFKHPAGKGTDLAGLPIVQPLLAFAQPGRLPFQTPESVAKDFKASLAQAGPALRNYLSEKDEETLVKSITTLSKHIGNQRAAIYRTANAAEAEKTGLFGFVVALDTTDGAAVEGALKDLIQIGKNAIEKAGDDAQGIKLVHKAGALTVGGAKGDTLTIDMPAEVKGMIDEQAKVILGPNWNTISWVRTGEKIVLQLGSDAETLAAAVELAKSGGAGLAGNDAVKAAYKRVSPVRGFELHVPIRTVAALVEAATAGNLTASLPKLESLTSIVASADGDSAAIEISLPMAELKAIVELVMKAQGRGQ